MVTWSRAVEADAQDSWRHRAVRWTITGGLFAYVGLVLWKHSATVHRAGNGSHESDALSDYTSPEGLRMTITAPFRALDLNIHYVCAVLLVPAAIAQKLLVRKMSLKGSQDDKERSWYRKNVHPNLGHATVALMAGMAYGGFAMRDVSAFPHFRQAMVFFVAPWVVLGGGILFTAHRGFPFLHAAMGNAIVKACVAVPLARVLGVVLQQYYATQSSTPSEVEATLSSGYYHGILASAVVTGVWALVDTYFLWRRCRSRPGTAKESHAG